MDFLGFIGSSELIVCAIVALIIFGPNRLPELARYLAKFSKMFREASRELQRQIDFHEIERELTKSPKPKTKPKAITTAPKENTVPAYQYNSEDESAHYNQLGEEGGYDGYTNQNKTTQKSTQENNVSDTAAVSEEKVQTTALSNRLVVDEDIKTQDAARLQRELID